DDSGSSNTDNITKNTSALTISGVGENGATVTLFDDANNNGLLDSGEILTTATVSSGTCSAAIALPDGGLHVRPTQPNVTGNVSGSSTALNITADTTATTPTVSLASDTGSSSTDTITKDASITVSAAAGDVSRTYSIDGGAASSTYTAPTADGSHTVTVTDT